MHVRDDKRLESRLVNWHIAFLQSRNFRDISLREGGSTGESFSDGITKRELILDSEFLDFPETSAENGLTAVIVNPLTGAFRDHLSGDWLRTHLAPPSDAVPNFVPRPDSHQYLRPWSDADLIELGLSSPLSLVAND